MINRKYIVCTPDQGLEEGMAHIVNASNESEALSKYAQHVMIKNELFLEYVYTNSVNMSYAEHFYRDHDGYFLDNYGNLRVDTDYAKQCFEENVRKMFYEHPQYASLYLDFFYYNESHSVKEAIARWNFPNEMLLYLWFADRDYAGELIVLDIDELIQIS
jgi:hypothetical protein